MKPQWSIQRRTVARSDGERRLDLAYQHLLRWAHNPTGDPARFALAQAAMGEMEVLADKSRYLHTPMFDCSFRNWKRKHLNKA